MPTPAPTHGYGTKLQIKIEGVWVTIERRDGDIVYPGLSRDTTETTHHDSPDMYKEYIRSLKDAGEFTFTIQYATADPSHLALLEGFEKDPVDDPDEFKFLPTIGDPWEVDGLVTGFKPKAPIGDIIKAEVTVKCTGAPTLPA